MDRLVPFLFVAISVAGLLVLLSAVWSLIKAVRARGLRGLWAKNGGSAWSHFWYTPADPTLLGWIRLSCGAVTTYTLFAYSFQLQNFMGKDAWYDLDLRQEVVRNKPIVISQLSGRDFLEGVPSNPEEAAYKKAYKDKWGLYPPGPFPTTQEEMQELDQFRAAYGYDLRAFGLPMPRTDEESDYIKEYMTHPANIMRRPPPAYPASAEESQAIYDYMSRQNGIDPRLNFARGIPAWSIWFHVTDPTAMMVIHVLIVLVCFLFTIGFCTRITSALTWMFSLWYIHRDPVALFGVDTMMTILLLYLMIGPSGGAVSVDRLMARWWHGAKPGVLNRWRRLLGKQPLPESAVQPAAYSADPVPSVSANFAVRLLQIHVCIIYFVSAISKLQGAAWWNGTAVWGTLANFEFAPMALEIGGVQVYNEFLRFLGQYKLRLELFLTGACMFTLVFEMVYAFLIWRPSMRWPILWGAIILHGFIGLLMGLKTFALMMLVMNLAFVKREEIDRALHRLGSIVGLGRDRPASNARPRLEQVAAK